MSLFGWLFGERPAPPPPPTLNGQMAKLDRAVAELDAAARELAEDPSALLRAMVHRAKNEEHIRMMQEDE